MIFNFNKLYIWFFVLLFMSFVFLYISHLRRENKRLNNEIIDLNRDIENLNKSNEITRSQTKKETEHKELIGDIKEYNALLNYFNTYFMQYSKSK